MASRNQPSWLPSSLTVLVDDREKKPLYFPETILWTPLGWDPILLPLEVQKQRMPCGDYCLAEFGKDCLVERKGSFSELFSNLLTKDRHRAFKAFKALAAATREPILLLEETPMDLVRQAASLVLPGADKPVEPGWVFDRLFEEVERHGLSLWWTGQSRTVNARRHLGELVVRRCLAAVAKHRLTKPPF